MLGFEEKSPCTQVTFAHRNALPFELHNYRFTQLIGHGGFAEVFLVTHLKVMRQYVAKVMTVGSDDMEHRWKVFDAEVSALSRLEHPNIVRLYDHFCIKRQFYMILEYCSAGSLHEEIYHTDGLAMERFLRLSKQIVSALCYCHDFGIAHRDIKPGNILLDAYGNAKLADFGLSYQGDVCRSQAGSIAYTAPEIFEKRPHDPKAGDVWALGVVFAMMATGASPWRCDCVGALKKLISTGKYQLQRDVPDALADLISRMIVVNPAQRLTMREVAARIDMMCSNILFKPLKARLAMRFHLVRRRRSEADAQEDMEELEGGRYFASATNSITQRQVNLVRARTKVRRDTDPLKPFFPSLMTFHEVDVEEVED